MQAGFHVNFNQRCPMTISFHDIDNTHPMIAPSILAADFSVLGAQVAAAEQGGAEVLHIDIMDGHFVPNLSMGSCVVKALRPHSKMLFDVHLMITHPAKYFGDFVKAGADHVTIHVESTGDIAATLQEIRAAGCTAGISLRPGTPVESLYSYLPLVDLVLVMTVEPGFGGQSFMAHQLHKVRALRDFISRNKLPVQVEVDGGIGSANIALAQEAGANVFVAGSSVFAPEKDPAKTAAALLQALRKAP